MEMTTTEEVGKMTEQFTGAYINRRTGAKVKVVRVKETGAYRAYVNGSLTVEGTRKQAMEVAR